MLRASMKYVAQHGMSDIARVRTVIDKAYESYATRLSDFDPQLQWTSERTAIVSFTAMRKKIEANFTLDDQEIRVEGDIPFLFRPFQGRIEKVLGEEIEKWIAKAHAGEV
jgi:hypothetical protein